MKKLRTALVILFAVLMSLGIFVACKPKGPDENGGDDTAKVTGVSVSGGISLTDSDTADTFQSKVANLRVTVRREGSTRGEAITGADCTFDTSAVKFGSVGTYTVKVLPKEGNTDNVSAETEVVIEHDFGEVVNGVQTCKNADKATKTTEDLTGVKLSYYSFHADGNDLYKYTKDDAPIPATTSSQLRAFGTVKNEDGVQTVNTLTAGRLEKGMTITVKATAVTTYEENNNGVDKGYYFPIIGFADRTRHEDGGYVGGTSVIVRNEGWVLWNGIGTPRLLAALAGGESESKNYATLPGDPSNGQEPAGYDVDRNTPTDVNNWGMWHTYSKGTGSNSATYASPQEIELIYNYREDGVIELTYRNTTSGITLTARTRVPDVEYYDTILHGEYVDYEFASISTIMTRTLDDVFYHGVKEGANKVYLENQMLNLSDFDVKATYAQTGATEQVVTTFDIMATTTENVTAVDQEGVTWVSLSEVPMSTAYKSFKVTLTSGVRTREKLIAAGEFVTTIPNAISSIYGKDVPGMFENNFRIGELTFTGFGEGSNIGAQINVVGGAQQLSAEQITAFEQRTTLTLGSDYRYVSLWLYAEGSSRFNKINNMGDYTAKYEKDNAAAPVFVAASPEGDMAIIVAAINSKDAILIDGLQETQIRLDFTGVVGLDIGSQVTRSDLKLNEGGTVTVLYTFTEAHYTELKNTPAQGGTRLDRTVIIAGDANVRLNQLQEGKYTLSNGVEIEVDQTNFTDAARQLEVTYKLPAFSAKNVAGFDLSLQTGLDASSMANRVTDTIYYDMEFATGDTQPAAISDKLFAQTDGTKLYVAQAIESENLTSQMLAGTVKLNINSGDIEALELTNLSWTFARGAVIFENKELPEGLVTAKVYTFGTLDNDKDTDWGAVVVLEIDTTKLGVESSPYLFELNADTEHAPTFYFKADGTTITRVTEGVAAATRLTLQEGDCYTEGLTAYEVKNGDDVVFYAGLNAFAGNHHVENGVCTLCGAIVEDKTAKLGWYTWSHSAAIAEGQIVEAQTTFRQAGGNLDGGVAVVIEEFKGSAIQGRASMNGSGYIEYAVGNWGDRNPPYADVEGFTDGNQKINNTCITEEHPYNTINGYLDSDGEPIDATSLQQAMAAGTYRIIVKHLGDKITVNLRLYKQGVALSSTPFYDITFTLNTTAGNTYNLMIGGAPDTQGVLRNDAWKIFKSNTVNSVLESGAGATVGDFTSENLVFGNVSMQDGYAVINASGSANKLPAGHSFGDNTHYAAFRLNFSQALPATSDLTLKDADGNAITGAVVELTANRTGVNVFIPIKMGAESDYYTLVLTNREGFTAQCPIKINFTEVAVSNIQATVSNNTVTLAGGSFTVTVTGTTLTTDMDIEVNGTKKGIDEIEIGTTTFGTLKVTAADLAAGSITFEQTALDFTKALTLHSIALFNGDDRLASTSVNCVVLPTGDSVVEDAYVTVSGTNVTFVFTDGVSKSSTKGFTLNANKGGDEFEFLANYDLTFKVNPEGTAVTFPAMNVLASKASGVYSMVGDRNVVAVTVDVSALGIATGDAYGFEAVIGAADTAVYRTVAANKTVSALTVDATVEDTTLIAATCVQFGLKAKVVGDPATFYFGLEVLPMAAHNWGTAEDGIATCSACGGIRKGGNSVNTEIAADKLADISTNGLTVSFFGQGDDTKDWDIRTLSTKFGNLVVMLPNIGGGDLSGKITTALPDSVTDADLIATFNKFTVSIYPVDAEKYDGADWNTLHNNEGFITIVIDTTEGVSFYLNGVLKIKFNPTRTVSGGATVNDFANTFLKLAELGGIDFATVGHKKANDLRVVPKALNATNVAAAYAQYQAELAAHVHSYSPTTDRCECGELNPNHGNTAAGGLAHNYVNSICTICGELDPNHSEHAYVNGVCVCGAVCLHEGLSEGHCSVCGITIADGTPTTIKTPKVWGATDDFTLVRGGSVKAEATYKSAGAETWSGLVARLNTPDPGNAFFIRPDGMSWFPWEFLGFGERDVTILGVTYHVTSTLNTGDAAQLKTYKAEGAKVTLEFTLATDGTLTFVQTITDADENEVYKYTATVTNLTQISYTLGFAMDGAELVADGEGNTITVTASTMSFDTNED